MKKNINKNQKEKEIIVSEIHKPARKHFPRRSTIVKGLKDLFQIDLIDMQSYHSFNKGFKYIMVIICCFSKYAWCYPLKNKGALCVTNAMQHFLQQGCVPKNLQSDEGTEFYNKLFSSLMRKYNINHYSTYTKMKAAIAERMVRTIKERLYKQFSLRGSYKWIDVLDATINDYNNTKHRTIKMKPIEVNKKNEKFLLNTVYSKKKVLRKPKFRVGDVVRISKQKGLFDKGYLPSWSCEEFTVVDINNGHINTYLLKDYQNNPILGAFYEKELQLVKIPGFYLVEKVLKKKGGRSYVKWLGFSNNHNSWIANK